MAEQWTRGSRDSDTRPESSTSIDTAWVRLSLWLDMQLCLLFLALEFYDLLCIPVLSTLEWRTPICYLHKDVKVFFWLLPVQMYCNKKKYWKVYVYLWILDSNKVVNKSNLLHTGVLRVNKNIICSTLNFHVQLKIR